MSIQQDSSKRLSGHSDEEEGNFEEGYNEARVISNLNLNRSKHENVINFIGKICILMLFIIFLILAVDVFSLLSRQHHNLEPDKQQNNFQLVSKEEPQNQQIQTNLVKSPIHNQEKISQVEEEQQIEQISTQSKSEIPRILWLQTDDELQVKGMQEAIVAQNLIHFAKLSNYQVRIVNNINAYDWLSQKSNAQIKQTHQKSKVDVPVEEMLRLALLAQHGGISIRLPNILLLQKMNWIQKIFQLNNLSQAEKKGLSCKQPKPKTQILVLHTINPKGYTQYEDDLIAARPNSALIKVIQLVFNKVIKEGAWPYPNFQIAVFNQITRIKSFPDMTKHLINIFSRQDSNLCRTYGLQSINLKEGPYASMISDDQASNAVKMDLKKFKQKYGQPKLLRIKMQKIAHDIVEIIKTGDMSFGNGNSLLKKKLMMIEGNKWLTIPKSQKRDVNFCIVSLKPQQNEQTIHKQLKQLSKQSFTNWNHVSFINNLPVVFKNITDKSIAVNASIYQGLNLQRAATKYCNHTSIILLLDNDEQLSSQQDLSKLAKKFQRIDTFAAFVHLKKDNQVYQTSSVSRKNIEKQKIQRTVNQPNHQLIKDISNFLRVFTVQIYRFISPNQLLHSSTGRYFDREIPLIAMLQLSEHFGACREEKIAYQVRKVQQLMAIPEYKIFSNIIIQITQFRQPHFTRFEYYGKFRHHELCNTIQFCKRNHLSVQKLVSFNDGRQNLHLSAKNSQTQKVPRKIHQIWITGQMPKFKQYLGKRLREAHPDYEYMLWSEDNFTRDNFPQSYDLLKNLLEYDRKIPSIKTSMIADIMRYEIVYMQGGFFVDTNFMFFGDRPLDKFLPYSMVLTGELSPMQKVYKDHSFFSCAQKCPQLASIVSHQSLSGRRKYSIDNDKETGRAYFAKIKIENKENIFQPSFEEFYPNLIYDFPVINRNRCIPSAVIDNQQILFNSTRRSYMKNCSKIYSYAYGINFMEEGFTFGASRW